MRKKNVIRFLRNVNDETTEQISKDYPGLTEEERDVLFDRIGKKIQTVQPAKNISENTEQFILTNTRHSSRSFPALSAAACILVFCGTFAGMFLMKSRLQPELPETKYAHSIGESYAAYNLTKSGKLLVTVTSTETNEEFYHVYVTLENKNAVSVSDETLSEPYLFMADNFMGAVGQTGENWVTVHPYSIVCNGEQGDLPNTIILRPDEICELELWFKKERMPDDWNLVTSYSTEYPYTVISVR